MTVSRYSTLSTARDLQDRRELKLVLIHTANARRSYAQKSLIAAQRSWINLITNTDVPIDRPKDKVVKRFCEVAGSQVQQIYPMYL
uniref:RolB family protein n=1 Tax=Agrobacterium fabrum TaxID=1176649 RepID=UPI003965B9EC